jgi:translation initiation factor 1
MTEPAPLKQPEPIIVRLEKSGRGGKAVTLLEGFRMHPAGKEELLRKFKRRCGTGGTLKNGVMEIQGDQRARLMVLLESAGYRVKVGSGPPL